MKTDVKSDAPAGSSDHGIFGSRAALDWLRELKETGRDALEDALETDADTPLRKEEGERVLAAAEVVVALDDRPSPDLPEEIANWAEKSEIDPGLFRERALRGIDLVLGAKSELRDLWSETGSGYDAWRRGLLRLRGRVEEIRPVTE